MPKLIFVTREWAALGLAMLAKSEGSKVIMAFDYDPKDQEDLDEVKKIGDGLVEKMPLKQATREFIAEDALWVFDTNHLPEVADRLRSAGEAVIGTSALSAKMENDRDYAAGVAEAVGLHLPETQKFTDYNAALTFLKSNKDKSYVYKPFKGDPTSTYVPQEKEDLGKANAELSEYIASLSGNKKPQFILQEVVEGIEVAFDMWLRDGKPVVAFCDLEAKRKLTGELGENVGCAGGYVFKVPVTCRGVQETVAKYLSWKELKNYTGSVDINIIYTKKGPLFLENCFRFGYNAYPAMFHCLPREPVEVVLREWVTGKGVMASMFDSGFAGSLTMFSDNPKSGSPIIVPKELDDYVDLYRAYSEDGHLKMVEGWPELLCVTCHEKTIEAAGQGCLEYAEEVSFPDKGFRVDLAGNSLPTLPLSRFRALQTRGLLG